MKYIFILITFLSTLSVTTEAELAKVTGYVNDHVGLLSKEQIEKLKKQLVTYESKTSNEFYIVTLKSFGSDTPLQYSFRLWKVHGFGKPNKDNGILILIAKDDRKLRISVGNGLEKSLTDEFCAKIIEKIMVPQFKKQQFYKGIQEAVDLIIKEAKHDWPKD